ncbi:hypothetical protein, partial [Daejeonella sp.]|uniref:hypothetical protein n=1 Tax=Daejeonella sp. TaxID=2805397 RepID=UPI0030C2D9CF
MKKMKLIIFCLTVLLFFNCGNISGNKVLGQENFSSDTTLIFKLTEVATGLNGPVALENAHDGSGRIFVGEQA